MFLLNFISLQEYTFSCVGLLHGWLTYTIIKLRITFCNEIFVSISDFEEVEYMLNRELSKKNSTFPELQNIVKIPFCDTVYDLRLSLH